MSPMQDAMTTSLESSGSQKNGGFGKLLLGLSVGLGIAAFFLFRPRPLLISGRPEVKSGSFACVRRRSLFSRGGCFCHRILRGRRIIIAWRGDYDSGGRISVRQRTGHTLCERRRHSGSHLGLPRSPVSSAGLGRTEIRESTGPPSRGFCQECVQLPHDLASDPTVSVLPGEYGVGIDESKGGNIHGCDIVGHHSREFRVCLCRASTWYDQFAQGDCFAQCTDGLYTAGTFGTGAPPLQEILRQVALSRMFIVLEDRDGPTPGWPQCPLITGSTHPQ